MSDPRLRYRVSKITQRVCTAITAPLRIVALPPVLIFVLEGQRLAWLLSLPRALPQAAIPKIKSLKMKNLSEKSPLMQEQDETYGHLFRIRYPDGWLSAPANLTRCKDAAYGHARKLLTPTLSTLTARAA